MKPTKIIIMLSVLFIALIIISACTKQKPNLVRPAPQQQTTKEVSEAESTQTPNEEINNQEIEQDIQDINYSDIEEIEQVTEDVEFPDI